MDICHLYDYEHDARIDAREYTEKHWENIKRIMFNNSSLRIWTEDGNVHHFMSGHRYSRWCKGRIYYMDGKLYHSGYELKE